MRLPFDQDWDPMRYGTDVRRAAEEATFPGQTAVLVIVTSETPVDRARLTQVLERGADVGVYGLFVAPVVDALPAVCRTFLDVSDGLEHGHAGTVRSGVDYPETAVEGVSNELMTMLAKRLSPVVDSSTVIEDSSDIPNSVMFLSLVGPETAEDSAFAIERWRENNTIIDRSGAAAASPEEGRRPARDRRAGCGGRDGARPARAGTARARGRHDRRRQVGVPAGVGARAWRPRTARIGSRSCSSTTRAARPSPTASSCRTASGSSPT